jgi:uncharacterized oxidoreductase
MKLTGHTILITGGSSGIGLGFALEFLKHGNEIIVCGRNEARLKDVKAKHPQIHIKVCDVSIETHRIELAQWIAKNHPGTNFLVNNAGVQLNNQVAGNADMEKLNLEIGTNLVAPIHLNSLFIPHLKTRNESVIVNITSGLAFVPLAFMPVYCATKAAMHSYTMSLRHLLKDTTVKVFEIAPPAVDTNLGSDRRTDKSQSHGGISIEEFLKEAMDGLTNDVYETAVGMAKGLREKRDNAFEFMNNR